MYPIADSLAARGVPFVFATAVAIESIPERYRRHPVVSKPYQTSELLGALDVALSANANAKAPRGRLVG